MGRREKWSSLLAFVWVAAGAAVGLGNIWKFPYMAGSHGGSAFVLMYLIFVLLVGIPVMAAEIMLGKLCERNPVDGFLFLAKLHGRSSAWKLTGYLGLTTLALVFCFYSVVAGFGIGYLYFSITNSFFNQSKEAIAALWVNFLANPVAIISCSFLFIILTMLIVYFGIKKGIEKACTFMMPALFAVLLVLVFYAGTSGGFNQAFSFLFSFEPSKIEPSVVIASLGHALFTLAVGACAMMVYGSYLPKRVSVAKSVVIIAILDVIVALLAGLAIFPLTFEHGLSPGQGPGLMFVSLPMVFTQMSFGWFWATLFFVLLFFAAISSSLSFAEPLVDFLMEKFNMGRHKATILIGAVICLGSTVCALSFNVWADIKLGQRFSIFDLVADISTNILLPIGAFAIAVFAGLIIKQQDFFTASQEYGNLLFRSWRLLTLIVAPIAIIIVMINSLKEFLI